MPVVEILQLPSGLELMVPEGQTRDQAYWGHCAAAVDAGNCPHHGTPLTPIEVAPEKDVTSVGYCPACTWYWGRTPAGAGWQKGFIDSSTGRYFPPEWLA